MKININGNEHEIVIKNTRSRKISISIKLNNEIIIKGNKLTEHQCFDIINKNLNFVINSINKFSSLREKYYLKEINDLKKIWLFGDLYNIKITDNKNFDLKTEHENLYIYEGYKNHLDRVRKYFSLFVQQRFFEIKNNISSKEICDRNISLRFKNIKSKYGYCLYNKNEVVLSLRLIHIPVRLIEYIIIHELCHFIYQNHKQEFYREVNKYCENYKKCTRELKEYSVIYSNS